MYNSALRIQKIDHYKGTILFDIIIGQIILIYRF